MAVADLLARVEDEATRMGLLVDDLLLLARLDQERPLQLAPVDVGALARAAAESARAAAPDRFVEVAVDGADLVVAGDEPRLRQVAANLLDNALAYFSASAPVTVRVGPVDRGRAGAGGAGGDRSGRA